MDKLENIRYIKLFFSFVFQKEIQVDFSVEEKCYRIGFDEYDLEKDNWVYIIYCFKNKFVKWTWETNRDLDNFSVITTYTTYNDFNSCLKGIIDFEKEFLATTFSNYYDKGFFDV